MSEVSRVLFVCMGNICRSPTAEGVFRHHVTDAGLLDSLEIDSAGTHAYHVGEPPDRRSRAAAERRGISLAGIAARRVSDDDFERFDLILAMDDDNYRRLVEQADAAFHAKIRLFLDYGKTPEREVPDPYYGGASGFERVLDLVEDASKGLLATIQR
ncbi:MAG: low molecular weight protein-tyrosine-phosphatase [Pseudomonadota bacterium]